MPSPHAHFSSLRWSQRSLPATGDQIRHGTSVYNPLSTSAHDPRITATERWCLRSAQGAMEYGMSQLLPQEPREGHQ